MLLHLHHPHPSKDFSHSLVESVEQLQANEIHITGTAQQDDQRELDVHDQQ